MEVVASLKDVKKEYKTGDTTIVALDTTSIEIQNNQLTLIMGPSGSGKTTLLSLIGCVIYPTSGRVFILDRDVTDLPEKKLADIRLNSIGFVFQHFNLLNPLTALENVMQPLALKGEPKRRAREEALKALEKVNMLDRKNNLPKKLSGGQKQRVAIARALVSDAAIILCDEPTASLDAKSAALVMEDLKQLAAGGKAVVVVTHDLRLRPFADRIIYVEEGKVSDKLKDEEAYK
ncbi:putative ABC transport system ATP-binding protein [Arcticibacter pallidicorallinus]|uniref:Putative ABC transport system ATP-binding protein n=1 Tax=Arcticibacter pallidicorallinus TaxID=1259464 RepID=A0A2T0TXH5_9SPHI|nr:ABC transporter ATP-binding protein [Arcticibacter pallidicorallinus]PRY50350.1 putative ABC transport system ATP-binding protein [Arcticibacter pallidicorallinus]